MTEQSVRPTQAVLYREHCETRSISLLPGGTQSVTDGRDFQNAVSANVCRLVENCTVLYKHY